MANTDPDSSGMTMTSTLTEDPPGSKEKPKLKIAIKGGDGDVTNLLGEQAKGKKERGRNVVQPLPLSSPTPVPKPRTPIRRSAFYFLKDLKTLELEIDQSVYIWNFSQVNRIFVVRADLQAELLDLSDDISEHVELEPFLQELPQEGEILLGRYGRAGAKSEKFHRAVVLQVLPNLAQFRKTMVKVKFVDMGDVAVLTLDDLKAPNLQIMNHPIYGQEVLLDGISPESEKGSLILWRDFAEFLSGVKSKLTIKIKKSAEPGESDQNKEMSSIPIVKLYRLNINANAAAARKKQKSLNSEILALGKWAWEKKFDAGAKTDDDIVIQKEDKVRMEIMYYDMNTQKLPMNSEIEMKILYFVDCSNFLCFPTDPSFHFKEELKTLEAQISRYCRMIKSSAFYPQTQQVFFLGMENEDKWIRATRFCSDGVLAIDSGETYPFRPREVEMRALPLDFARIPGFGIQCSLTGLPTTEILSEAELKSKCSKIFTRESIHHFYIRGLDKDVGIYTMECEALTKLLKI